MQLAALIRKTHLATRRIRALAIALLLAVVAVGLAAPVIDASRFGERIRQKLEATLGRSVRFEAVHFTLFSGPGFSLQDVVIGEDPRYGIEAFAYVPEMQVRVRPDKLLLGLIQISSLRLLDPSLNLVKQDDGTWNALELVQRLSAPRRLPLAFFPVFEVLRGRIDFKFGSRKTTLYLLDSDLQIFPERSNTLRIQFSGSPARTDRAGNGFGHLHGTVSWFSNRKSAGDNQLEADLILDPSNLSEITTLVEGHDVGVHGTISSRARIDGPLAALRVHGEMQLTDVHRWDLMPANGNEWRVPYRGDIDLLTNRLALETAAAKGEVSPVTLRLLIGSFLTDPRLSLQAHLERVPAGEVLPLGRRLGLVMPSSLAITGNLSGDLSFATQAGLAGRLLLADVHAELPQVEPLQAARVEATIVGDRLLFRPAQIQTASGVLQLGGEIGLSASRSNLSVVVDDFSIAGLKRTLTAWLSSPPTLESLADGRLTGSLVYSSLANSTAPAWSEKFDFAGATVSLPGLASPLVDAAGRVSHSGSNFEITHFSAHAGSRLVQASYRFNPSAKRPERLHLEVPAAELGEIQNLFAPTVQGQGWLARFGVTRRAIPAWLADRDLEADINIDKLLLGDVNLGSLNSQLSWQGTTLHFPSVTLKMQAGTVLAHGAATLVSYRPKVSFSASVFGFRWHGGTIQATADVDTFGLGGDALKNLRAAGTFAATNLRLTADDVFPFLTGDFLFSYRDGWPDLRLPTLQAADADGDWSGTGLAQSDGRLVLALEHAGQQRRVVSALASAPAGGPATLADH